jgi:hypothetical protein
MVVVGVVVSVVVPVEVAVVVVVRVVEGVEVIVDVVVVGLVVNVKVPVVVLGGQIYKRSTYNRRSKPKRERTVLVSLMQPWECERPGVNRGRGEEWEGMQGGWRRSCAVKVVTKVLHSRKKGGRCGRTRNA